MNITSKMLRQAEASIGSGSGASIIVLPDGHYLQLEFNDGRELYRRRIDQFDFGHGITSHEAMLEAWEQFISEVVGGIKRGFKRE